jgi:hypothetical protein
MQGSMESSRVSMARPRGDSLFLVGTEGTGQDDCPLREPRDLRGTMKCGGSPCSLIATKIFQKTRLGLRIEGKIEKGGESHAGFIS